MFNQKSNNMAILIANIGTSDLAVKIEDYYIPEQGNLFMEFILKLGKKNWQVV